MHAEEYAACGAQDNRSSSRTKKGSAVHLDVVSSQLNKYVYVGKVFALYNACVTLNVPLAS